MSYRSGFVALVGKPNVGKSSLVNALLGRKVSITSSKPQTTRRRILGVLHGDDYQIVLVDTPGVNAPQHLLGRKMVHIARTEGREADLALFVVELTHRPTAEDREALALLQGQQVPVILVGNKVDRAGSPDALLPMLAAYAELGEFAEVFPVSALEGSNLEKLRSAMVGRLQEGDPYFPPDMVTDLDPSTVVEEAVRARVLELTRQEIPHCVAVKVEDMGPGENPEVLWIRAHLYVEKPGQKRILVGKGGELLKRIGSEAREQLEQEFGRRIFLDLWVKVKADWRDREDWLRSLGYE